MNENIQTPVPEVKKKSNTWKWIVGGCGCGCFSIIIALFILGFYGGRYAKAKINNMRNEFLDQGYKEIKGQVINVKEEVHEKMLYTGQIVKVTADCHDDIAFVCQVAEIYSTIDGKVSFRGQMLVIHPNAHVTEGLDVKAQVIQVMGQVEGEITGSYQQIMDQRKPVISDQ